MAQITPYLKRMIPSLLMMVLITYGIKEQNPWLQYGSIFLLLIGQMVYQSVKTVRSKPLMDANIETARKMMRRKPILEVKKGEVSKAKELGQSIGGVSPKMGLLLIVPLAIFLGTGYLLNYLSGIGVLPEIEQWQSYAIGFLITMPVSTILSIRMGLGSQTMTASPNSYSISEKGIVFEHMAQYYFLPFPIVNMDVKEESNCLEVEGPPSNSPIIPNKIRLFNMDVEKLQRLLTRYSK